MQVAQFKSQIFEESVISYSCAWSQLIPSVVLLLICNVSPNSETPTHANFKAKWMAVNGTCKFWVIKSENHVDYKIYCCKGKGNFRSTFPCSTYSNLKSHTVKLFEWCCDWLTAVVMHDCIYIVCFNKLENEEVLRHTTGNGWMKYGVMGRISVTLT